MTLVVRVPATMNIDYNNNVPLVVDGVRPAVQDAPLWTFIVGPHIAGEAIMAGQPVYQKPADGKWYRSVAVDGTAASDNVHGWSFATTAAGQILPVVHARTNFGYSDGTAPIGRPLFLSSTAGNLDTAPHYGGQLTCAYSVDGYSVDVVGYVFANYNGT